MRRRLDLGASLVGHPSVLILDEPTTGLDPRTRNDVWQFIADLVADGTTLLLTTQYLEEADGLAHRLATIDVGIAKRNLLRIARTPQLLFFASVQPVMLVLLFRYVFGGTIKVPGLHYVDYLLRGIFVQTALFGGVGSTPAPTR